MRCHGLRAKLLRYQGTLYLLLSITQAIISSPYLSLVYTMAITTRSVAKARATPKPPRAKPAPTPLKTASSSSPSPPQRQRPDPKPPRQPAPPKKRKPPTRPAPQPPPPPESHDSQTHQPPKPANAHQISKAVISEEIDLIIDVQIPTTDAHSASVSCPVRINRLPSRALLTEEGESVEIRLCFEEGVPVVEVVKTRRLSGCEVVLPGDGKGEEAGGIVSGDRLMG